MARAIPGRMSTVVTDRLILCMQDTRQGELMIHLEAEFPASIDPDRLARACRLLLDAEPVLGSRLVADPGRPWWERLPPERLDVCRTTADASELEPFRAAPIDPRDGAQVRVLHHAGPGGDRLIVKVCHICADAGGTKHVVALLSSIYERLGREPRFRPEPNLDGPRGLGQILGRLPWHAWPRMAWNYAAVNVPASIPPNSIGAATPACAPSPLTWAVRHLDRERVARLVEWGHARNATLNDVLVAAYARALTAEYDPGRRKPLRFPTTIDLRRWYIPGGRASGICNLSAYEPIRLGRRARRSFEAAAAAVSARMRARKRNLPGLFEVGAAPILASLPYASLLRVFGGIMGAARRGGGTNGFTNMGPIPPEEVTFGVPPARAWLLIPPMYPPWFTVGASGHAGTLTITSGVPTGVVGVAETLLARMVAELPH